MADTHQIFVPLIKVDEATQQIWGTAAIEEPDCIDEVMDYATSKPEFIAWSTKIRKDSGGKSLGNVREMHGLTAVGKVISLHFNDVTKSLEIGTKIVERSTWNKVLEGVLTGFSIGGRYLKTWMDGKHKRYTIRPMEISVVDSPAMSGATFSLVKANGTTETRVFKQVQPRPMPPTAQSTDFSLSDPSTDTQEEEVKPQQDGTDEPYYTLLADGDHDANCKCEDCAEGRKTTTHSAGCDCDECAASKAARAKKHPIKDSVDSKRRRVAEAIHEKHKTPNGGGAVGDSKGYVFVAEFFDGFAIVECGGDFYKIPYTEDSDGKITLGDPLKVEPTYVEAAKAARAAKKDRTKRVADVDLSADSFAYVGDPERTETWKLPIEFPGDEEKTKRHIRNALARFNQTQGIPASERRKVKKRILAAAKKHGIDVKDEAEKCAAVLAKASLSPLQLAGIVSELDSIDSFVATDMVESGMTDEGYADIIGKSQQKAFAIIKSAAESLARRGGTMEVEKARNVHHHLRKAAEAVHEHHKKMVALHHDHAKKLAALAADHESKLIEEQKRAHKAQIGHLEDARKAAGNYEGEDKLIPSDEPIDMTSQEPAPVGDAKLPGATPNDLSIPPAEKAALVRDISEGVMKTVLGGLSEVFAHDNSAAPTNAPQVAVGNGTPVTKAAAAAPADEKINWEKVVAGDPAELQKAARTVRPQAMPTSLHTPGMVSRG